MAPSIFSRNLQARKSGIPQARAGSLPPPAVHWPHATPQVSQAKPAPPPPGGHPSPVDFLPPRACPPAPPLHWPSAKPQATQPKMAPSPHLPAACKVLQPRPAVGTVVQPKLSSDDAFALFFYWRNGYGSALLPFERLQELHRECVKGCDHLEQAKDRFDSTVETLTGTVRPPKAVTVPPGFKPVFMFEGGGGGGSESPTIAPDPPKKKGGRKVYKDITQEFFSTPPPSAWVSGPPTASGGSTPSSSPVITTTTPITPTVSTADTIIGKLSEWKPSQGHGGFNARKYKPKVEDLQGVVDWANAKGKYFVKKGFGTGEYSSKQQLKVIHKTVVAPGGKKATFHISVNSSVLAQLALEVEN